MSTMRAQRELEAEKGTQPSTHVLKLLGWFLMLQGLVCLLVPGIQALRESQRVIRSWSSPQGPHPPHR